MLILNHVLLTTAQDTVQGQETFCLTATAAVIEIMG